MLVQTADALNTIRCAYAVKKKKRKKKVSNLRWLPEFYHIYTVNQRCFFYSVVPRKEVAKFEMKIWDENIGIGRFTLH